MAFENISATLRLLAEFPRRTQNLVLLVHVFSAPISTSAPCLFRRGELPQESVLSCRKIPSGRASPKIAMGCKHRRQGGWSSPYKKTRGDYTAIDEDLTPPGVSRSEASRRLLRLRVVSDFGKPPPRIPQNFSWILQGQAVTLLGTGHAQEHV